MLRIARVFIRQKPHFVFRTEAICLQPSEVLARSPAKSALICSVQICSIVIRVLFFPIGLSRLGCESCSALLNWSLQQLSLYESVPLAF